MSNKKHTQEELEAAYNNGYNKGADNWLIVGITIGFIVGCCITYLKLKH